MLILLGGGFRIFIAPAIYGMIWPDSLAYYHFAEAFLHHTPYKHALSHTPLYSLFLALFLRLGENPTVGLYFIHLQQAFGVLASILVYVIGLLVFSPWLAFTAALLYSFSAMLIFYELTVHTELLFMVILYSLIIAVLVTAKNPNPRRYVIIGLISAIAALTRPVAQFYVVIIVFFLFFASPEKKKLRSSIIIVLTYFISMMPWMLYNQKIHGFFGTSKGHGNNLYYRTIDLDHMRPRKDSKYPIALSAYRKLRRPNGITYHAMRRALEATPGLTPVTADEQMLGFAWETLKRYPFRYLKNTALGFVEFFINPRVGITTCPTKGGRSPCCRRPKSRNVQFPAFPNRPVQGASSAKTLLNALLQTTRYPMGLIGAFALIGYLQLIFSKWRSPFALPESFLMLSIFYFTAFPCLLNAPEDRYRLPVDPFIFMLALTGLVYILSLFIGLAKSMRYRLAD